MPNDTAIYAGGLRRFVAVIIDSIIFGAFFFILKTIVSDYLLQNIIYLIVCTIYYVVLESSKFQASIGMMLMKIFVGTPECQQISLLRAGIRYFFWMSPGIPFIVFMVSPEFIAFNEKLEQTRQYPDAHHALMHSATTMYTMLILNVLMFGFVLFEVLAFGLPILFTKQKTGLHDILSRTRVYKRQKPILP